jgi:ABC-type transporter Mla maintaining outer membrane lipid asymmetry ATPase subunit MlaF
MPSRSETPSAEAAIAVRDLDIGYGTFVVQHNLNFQVSAARSSSSWGSGCGKARFSA